MERKQTKHLTWLPTVHNDTHLRKNVTDNLRQRFSQSDGTPDRPLTPVNDGVSIVSSVQSSRISPQPIAKQVIHELITEQPFITHKEQSPPSDTATYCPGIVPNYYVYTDTNPLSPRCQTVIAIYFLIGPGRDSSGRNSASGVPAINFSF